MVLPSNTVTISCYHHSTFNKKQKNTQVNTQLSRELSVSSTDGEVCIPLVRREFHPAAEHQKISILNHQHVSGCLDRAQRCASARPATTSPSATTDDHLLMLRPASQSPTVKLILTPHSWSPPFQQFSKLIKLLELCHTSMSHSRDKKTTSTQIIFTLFLTIFFPLYIVMF